MRKIIFSVVIVFVAAATWLGWRYTHPEKAPMVTVLMSTYNRGTTLGPSVESILTQTYPDFELMIVNDGSTDHTAEVLKGYAKRDSRVVILTNEKNKGLVYSLNRGIEAARGKYIVRMDDDDFSVPYRLERQVAAMEKYSDIIVMGGGMISIKTPVSTLKKETGEPQIYEPFDIALNTYFSAGLAHPTVIIRKDFLIRNNLRYRDIYLYAEDVGLWKDVLNTGGQISILKEGVLFYGAMEILPVPRAKEYGYVQQQSWRKVQKEKFARFFPVTDEDVYSADTPVGKCRLLQKMKQANLTKKLMKQSDLEKYFADRCIDNLDSAFYFEHPYWKDIITITDDRVKRRGGDLGTITKREGDTITVKWDKWDVEIYQKTKTGYRYLKDENGNIKVSD